MPANRQQPVIQPGFAIFCFPAGIVEMILRISLAILLIVCLVLSAATPGGDHIASFWNILATGIALFFELIHFVLRFLNIRYYNNYYKVYGVLDIIRYILVALFLAFGCAVYAISASFATGTDAECNGHAESTGELDTACELREHATYYTVVVVFCVVAIGVTIVSAVWQCIYTGADCNNRLPVRREGDET